MKVCYTLGMPNVGSWNGRWTGEGETYCRVRTYFGEKAKKMKAMFEKEEHPYFYYNFEDGWGASVTMKHVNAAEAKKLTKLSLGFSGYDWMINEIEEHGRILSRSERKEREATHE